LSIVALLIIAVLWVVDPRRVTVHRSVRV
jgi:hypothetical protein